MVPVKQSLRFTIYFYGAIAVAVVLVSLLLNGALTLTDPWTTLRTTSTALLVAYLVSYVITRWWWRWFPFRALLAVPDLAGRWEGWYWNTLGKTWLPGVLEVGQQAHELTVTAYGKSNRSRSLCSAVLVDAYGATDLVWSYSTDPLEGSASQHRGTAMLSVENSHDGRLLRGTYCTDGVRTEDGTIGKGGFIRYAYAGRTLRQGLGPSLDQWAMKQPVDPPS